MDYMTLRRKKIMSSYVALLVYEKPRGLYGYTARYVNNKLFLAYKNKTRCTLPGDKPFGAWKLTGTFNNRISVSLIRDMAIARKAIYKKEMAERLDCMDARISTLKPNQCKSFYNFLLTLE
jgi:hypothetical protein